MITVTIRINATPDAAQGVKEALAMWLERFGDIQVVSIVADHPEQLTIKKGDYGK